jgi:hypothetical protein
MLFGQLWTAAALSTALRVTCPTGHATGVCPAAVTGLDMCVRQPLIATCSMDRSVHLWNYVDRSCELTKTFSEEAYSIAIHPTGLQVRCPAAEREHCTAVMLSWETTAVHTGHSTGSYVGLSAGPLTRVWAVASVQQGKRSQGAAYVFCAGAGWVC